MRIEHAHIALGWIAQDLKRFLSGIRGMITELDISQCPVFSFLPYLPPKEELERFDRSFIKPGDSAEHVYEQIGIEQHGFISDFLRQDLRHLAMFQTDYFRVNSHPKRIAVGERIILFDRSELPHDADRIEGWVYLKGMSVDSLDVLDLVMRGIWPHYGLGILTSCAPKLLSGETVQRIDVELARELTQSAEYLVIGAYDGDALMFVDLTRARKR